MLKYAIDLNKYKNRDPRPGKENYHEEYQYLNLLKDLMEHGTLEEGRNGKTKRSVGSAMHFSLEGGKLKKLLLKLVFVNYYGLLKDKLIIKFLLTKELEYGKEILQKNF
jgi:hypothetical protein